MNESVTHETSPTSPTGQTAGTALTALSDADRQLALERFHLLQPYLEQGVSLTRVAREAGISYRTALRWASLYRRFGLSALARKGRTDKGERRVLSPQMRKAVEGLALQTPPLPIATLYRKIYKLAHEQGEKLPSYSVIYDVVSKLPDDLVTLAHEGTKAYSDSFELVHRREAERPNAVWQADHTLLDILLIRNDGDENDQKDTEHTKTRKPCKPWL